MFLKYVVSTQSEKDHIRKVEVRAGKYVLSILRGVLKYIFSHIGIREVGNNAYITRLAFATDLKHQALVGCGRSGSNPCQGLMMAFGEDEIGVLIRQTKYFFKNWILRGDIGK